MASEGRSVSVTYTVKGDVWTSVIDELDGGRFTLAESWQRPSVDFAARFPTVNFSNAESLLDWIERAKGLSHFDFEAAAREPKPWETRRDSISGKWEATIEDMGWKQGTAISLSDDVKAQVQQELADVLDGYIEGPIARVTGESKGPTAESPMIHLGQFEDILINLKLAVASAEPPRVTCFIYGNIPLAGDELIAMPSISVKRIDGVRSRESISGTRHPAAIPDPKIAAQGLALELVTVLGQITLSPEDRGLLLQRLRGLIGEEAQLVSEVALQSFMEMTRNPSRQDTPLAQALTALHDSVVSVSRSTDIRRRSLVTEPAQLAWVLVSLVSRLSRIDDSKGPRESIAGVSDEEIGALRTVLHFAGVPNNGLLSFDLNSPRWTQFLRELLEEGRASYNTGAYTNDQITIEGIAVNQVGSRRISVTPRRTMPDELSDSGFRTTFFSPAIVTVTGGTYKIESAATERSSISGTGKPLSLQDEDGKGRPDWLPEWLPSIVSSLPIISRYEADGKVVKVSKGVKIIATVGKASESEECLRQLIMSGVNIFRINFSHVKSAESREWVLNVVKRIREAANANDLKRPVTILADTKGPEIRTEDMSEAGIGLAQNGDVIITAKDGKCDYSGAAPIVRVTYPEIVKELKQGERVLIGDGNIELKVTRISKKQGYVACKVVRGGQVTNRQGVNLPDSTLSVQGLTDEDRRDLEFAIMTAGVDGVAQSFIRSPDDVEALKKYISELMERLPEGERRRMALIAKIETPQAFERIDEIMPEVDAVMVARGDLGVETSPEEVPVIQKKLIAACIAGRTPVIIATEMLETMINKTRPARAEAGDVFNAVFDGADVVMTSGETAKGEDPVNVIRTMTRVVQSAEALCKEGEDVPKVVTRAREVRTEARSQTMTLSTFAMAERNKNVRAVIVFTASGGSALRMAQLRPDVPIIAITPSAATLHRLNLIRGVYPVLVDREEPKNRGQFVDYAIAIARQVIPLEQIAEEQEYLVALTYGPEGRSGFTDTVQLLDLNALSDRMSLSGQHRAAEDASRESIAGSAADEIEREARTIAQGFIQTRAQAVIGEDTARSIMPYLGRLGIMASADTPQMEASEEAFIMTWGDEESGRFVKFMQDDFTRLAAEVAKDNIALASSLIIEAGRLDRIGGTMEVYRDSISGTPKPGSADWIYNNFIVPDVRALEATLTFLRMNPRLTRKGKVMIVHDTALSDVETSDTARSCEVLINRYLDGNVIGIRATGRKLLESIQKEVSALAAAGENVAAIVIITGDGTMREVGAELRALKNGTVINIANPGNRVIPVPALDDLALRVAYRFDNSRILECLKRVGSRDDNRPFTVEDVKVLLSTGIIRLLPAIIRNNKGVEIESYTRTRQLTRQSA